MKNLLQNKLLPFLLLFAGSAASAQDSTKPQKRFTILPLPVVYYQPETRFVVGVAAVLNFRFPGDSLGARPSSLINGIAYTQNKQLLLYSNFNVFYNNAQYYLFGEIGYYKYSYKYFGIGARDVKEELYEVDYPRIKASLVRRILPHVYAGIGYQYEDYRVKNLLPGGVLENGVVPGATGSETAGLGLTALYDSRDSVFYPNKGVYAQFSTLHNGTAVGGDRSFSRYILDVAYYRALRSKTILALNSYNSFVVGNAPFQQQSLIGGNRKMRGYYEGRYIDKNQVTGQAEVRFPIKGRFGAAVFGSAAFLGNESQFLRTGEPIFAGGGGIRFNAIRKDHLNIRLDYAIGRESSGIYLVFGEAF